MPDGGGARSALALLVEIEGRVAAIGLDHVSETLRPLALEPVAGAPDGILGVSVVRGEAVPVVDLGAVLGEPRRERRRWVALQIGARRAALAVDAARRIVPWNALEPKALPPLLEGAAQGAIGAMATHDRGFLAVLETARLVPEDVWARLRPRQVAP